MIVGEEDWIGQYNDEEYDLFFKKIRKKIKKKVKKIKPLKIFNPIRTVTAAPKFVTKKIAPRRKSSPQQIVNVQSQVNQATETKEVQLANERQDLLQEMAAFEENKVQEISKLDEEKIKTEQTKIDIEQGQDRKYLYIGLAGLGVLVVVGGIIVFIKSRQNKLQALTLQQLKTV